MSSRLRVRLGGDREVQMNFTRITKQRTAILEVLEESGCPLRPEKLLELTSHKVGGIGLATVYRTIKALSDAELVEQVIIPGHPNYYRLIDKSASHNHYFYCNNCQSVIPTGPFNLDADSLNSLTPKGALVRSYTITLFGDSCSNCR